MLIKVGFGENIIGKLITNVQFYSIINILESVIKPHITAFNFTELGNKCPLDRLIYIICIRLYKVKVYSSKMMILYRYA